MQTRHVHFDLVDSTMERAKDEIGELDFLLVTAEAQNKGRGTKGRTWQSPKGNLYLTVALHRRYLPPERLRLFPLMAGCELWEAVATAIPPHQRGALRLKWPNDVLWSGQKTAGMLMESSGSHFFVGVGVNIVSAPPIADGGTASTCLVTAGAAEDCGIPLALHFFQGLQTRLGESESRAVLPEWREKAEWNTPFRLRDRAGSPRVFPVDVNEDGHLRVRGDDGREETLISEYLA